ncbi:hypothetical protein [Pseudomonas sp. EpS/L25]|uniref:hypothetical protein n=1 Tax=Pseudomonas sp. EpS/L25 TaxID=1749078 RepID=UPI000A856C00|nr:hypothetical protein [Pseudomonas sp. EpS/L25]
MNKKRLLLFFSLLLSSAVFADENIVAPLVEDDLRQAKADVRTYERNIKSIDELLTRIQNTQLQKKPKDANSENSWEKGKAIIENNKTGKVGQKDYRQSLELITQSLEGAVDLKGNFWNRSVLEFYIDQDTTPDSKYLRIASNAANDALKNYLAAVKSSNGNSSFIIERILPNSRIFLSEMEDLEESELATRVSELKSLISKGYDAVYTSIQEGYFEAAVNGKNAAEQALKSIRTREKENLDDKRKALSSFIIEFKTLEKRDEARRESTDIRLVYAVYGMIGVLLFLFLGLKVLQEDVAKSLIVNRSLVEVVGMAFMLITIIILGTGEKLSKEILGTLLGTIAGYVFARGTEDSRTSRRNINTSNDT